MNIVLTLDKINTNNIYYQEPIYNTVMENGEFVKIIYSDENVMITGLHILLSIKPIVIDKYYNKFKLTYDLKHYHNDIFKKICNIENEILNKYISNKTKKHMLYDMVNTSKIVLFSNNELYDKNNLIIKISGIWENETNYGITYKILLN